MKSDLVGDLEAALDGVLFRPLTLHAPASEVGLIIVIAALMVACVPAYAMAQAKSGPPEFDNARYDEDYSYLRDPANWTGAWWERYKFIPLDPSGTRYLTLGADLRPRYEHYVNRNWGDPPDPTDGYGWLRIMPYADLHLGPNVRLFGQLIGAWAFDMEPAPSPGLRMTDHQNQYGGPLNQKGWHTRDVTLNPLTTFRMTRFGRSHRKMYEGHA